MSSLKLRELAASWYGSDLSFRARHATCVARTIRGLSVNNESLSEIPFYSMFHKLPVTRKLALCIVYGCSLITTVREKVANSIGFPQIKGQIGVSCRGNIMRVVL